MKDNMLPFSRSLPLCAALVRCRWFGDFSTRLVLFALGGPDEVGTQRVAGVNDLCGEHHIVDVHREKGVLVLVQRHCRDEHEVCHKASQ